MTDAAFQVPVLFDYVATFTWAVSGAIVAIRRRLDVTGVFVVALLAALGGGLLRDAAFLNRTPVALVNPMYLTLVFGSTVVTSVFARYLRNIVGPIAVQKIVDYIDALGTPAFAVFGMQLAGNAGLPLVPVLFVGVANGVAGGVLRDVVVRDIPTLMRPGQYQSITLFIACGLYLLLTLQAGLSPTSAAWITVAAFFIARVLTIRFNWQTRAVWEDESGSGGSGGSHQT
ncbi:MAG TPA: TRIC cation channel family protein [Steroidobacteraceae bacterium]|nr:TRIC cation channel family protein [Steroidobacteraceae bacterium]